MRVSTYLLFILLLSSACSDEKQVRKALAGVDQAALLAEAQELRASTPIERTVPKSSWPPSILRFDPKEVYVGADGVFLATTSLLTQWEGLFIATDGAFTGVGRSDPWFTRITGPFFFFRATG